MLNLLDNETVLNLEKFVKVPVSSCVTLAEVGDLEFPILNLKSNNEGISVPVAAPKRSDVISSEAFSSEIPTSIEEKASGKALKNSISKKQYMKNCPVCCIFVLDLPDHLTHKHMWSAESAKSVIEVYRLRKPYKKSLLP
nr:uncharacterized protein LOC124817795 isoform X2 [Hydra vulgaris]